MKPLEILIAAACLAAAFPDLSAEAAEDGRPRYAIINLSVNFLREEPDYTAELGTQGLMGDVVEIIDEEGYWKQVRTEEPYTAWCTDMGLAETDASGLEEYRAAPKYICTAWKSTVYSGPSEKSIKICDLVEGDIMRQSLKTRAVREETDGKTSVSGMEKRHLRPVTRRGFAEVVLPDGRTGYVPRKDVTDYGRWEAGCDPTAENIMAEAMKFVGVPYLWGGASPYGVDCSGLVRHVFRMNGILLPRNASQQALSGSGVDIPAGPDLYLAPDADADSDGIEALTAVLRPGDLLFFGTRGKDGHRDSITHVGIYLGDGRMIHSSHLVRINSLIPGREDYYDGADRLLKARRIIR